MPEFIKRGLQRGPKIVRVSYLTDDFPALYVFHRRVIEQAHQNVYCSGKDGLTAPPCWLRKLSRRPPVINEITKNEKTELSYRRQCGGDRYHAVISERKIDTGAKNKPGIGGIDIWSILECRIGVGAQPSMARAGDGVGSPSSRKFKSGLEPLITSRSSHIP